MTELRFDGRVAIVTGAGGGLGRAHALLLASRGAKVVVNDLGGSVKGGGASSSAADKVVAEIVQAGGEAVASYDSVEDGAKIVQTAIDAFGKIEIVINNAGILRDVSFPKMTESDWDLVYRVHVLGAFRVTHAAWPYMRDAGYGRVVMTASTSGIYGNFGQSNYSMAKLGLYGFTQTLALEGKKRNILVNAIAPTAASRMTEELLPPALIEALKPELVSPMVARLVHESNEDTGGLYEVGGGYFAKLRWERTGGVLFRVGRAASIEDVDAAWKAITTFENTDHPGSAAEALRPLIENVEAGPSKGGNEYIDVDVALGYQYPEFQFNYDERDVAIYALGVGAAKDPTDERDLPLVYELSGKGMKALPSFGVMPAINMVFAQAKSGASTPGLRYGLDRILHGEQHTELKRPLPTHGKLTTKATIKSIYDKVKGAVINTEFITYDEAGDELVRNHMATFVRGAGGWGGERGPSVEVNVPPDRAPDKVVEDKTSENQALLYRLSGDWNPLHADPAFARGMGFVRPILHGLCSYGFATRHVGQAYAPDGNVDYVKSIQVRFAKTVLPGQTIITEMWKDSDTKIVFRCKVKETGEICISNAAIELWKELPKPKVRAAAGAKDAVAKPAAAAADASAPTTGDIFRAVGVFVKANPATAEKVKTTFLFKLSAPESSWTIDLATPPGTVSEGAVGKAACTLEISDADFMAMATGKVDAMKLFSTGKLKISGDVMASQKLGFLRKITPEMVAAEIQRRLGAAPTAAAAPAAAAAAPAPTAEPQAAKVFAALARRLADKPGLAQEVRATVKFEIKNPDASQTLDLGGADPKKVDAVCTINDADLAELASGKATPQKLYQQGKLRIDGDVSVGHRLGFLKGLI
jgi:3-hydroxyacyl-CoA dehydrogenase/3a,7a,12a-trihydroxy-5b-cholest-24-enoyl-CoA hydratase